MNKYIILFISLTVLLSCLNDSNVTSPDDSDNYPKALNLSRSEYLDLSTISHLHNLEYLDISRSRVYNFSSLAELTLLKYLDISEVNNSIESKYHLEPPQLDVLDFNVLSNFVNLETLDITKVNISDLSPISGLVKLKRLYAMF